MASRAVLACNAPVEQTVLRIAGDNGRAMIAALEHRVAAGQAQMRHLNLVTVALLTFGQSRGRVLRLRCLCQHR